MTVVERILAKVEVSAEGCLFLTGRRHDRYAVVNVEGRARRGSRFMYEAFVGPIPDGLQLDHLCRNRGCINPGHLEPVTNRENARRGLHGILLERCPHGHPYDDENTVVNSAGGRECRACIRERSAESYRRDREATKARSRAYYDKNRKAVRARQREYRQRRRAA